MATRERGRHRTAGGAEAERGRGTPGSTRDRQRREGLQVPVKATTRRDARVHSLQGRDPPHGCWWACRVGRV